MASRNGIYSSLLVSAEKGLKILGLDIASQNVLENKLLNQIADLGGIIILSQASYISLIPVIASTYCGKYLYILDKVLYLTLHVVGRYGIKK